MTGASFIVIPAKAGTYLPAVAPSLARANWVPALAGMTEICCG